MKSIYQYYSYKADLCMKIKEYTFTTISEINNYLEENNKDYYQYILEHEKDQLSILLNDLLKVIPQGMSKSRQARAINVKANEAKDNSECERLLIYSYAVAAKSNSDYFLDEYSSILIAILYYNYQHANYPKNKIIQALIIGFLYGEIYENKLINLVAVYGYLSGLNNKEVEECILKIKDYNIDSLSYGLIIQVIIDIVLLESFTERKVI